MFFQPQHTDHEANSYPQGNCPGDGRKLGSAEVKESVVVQACFDQREQHRGRENHPPPRQRQSAELV